MNYSLIAFGIAAVAFLGLIVLGILAARRQVKSWADYDEIQAYQDAEIARAHEEADAHEVAEVIRRHVRAGK